MLYSKTSLVNEQRRINVEILNVDITLILTTLDNFKRTFLFSMSNFLALTNVKTSL